MQNGRTIHTEMNYTKKSSTDFGGAFFGQDSVLREDRTGSGKPVF